MGEKGDCVIRDFAEGSSGDGVSTRGSVFTAVNSGQSLVGADISEEVVGEWVVGRHEKVCKELWVLSYRVFYLTDVVGIERVSLGCLVDLFECGCEEVRFVKMVCNVLAVVEEV